MVNNFQKYVLYAMAILFAIVGLPAGAFEIGPVSAPLEPMVEPKSNYAVGQTRTDRNPQNGVETKSTIVEVNDTSYTVELPDGCRNVLTRDSNLFFLPYLESICKTGKEKIRAELIDGDVWPLVVGKKWRYRFEGSDNSGNSFASEMKCKVEEEFRVGVPAGEFDTFRVFCDAEFWTKNYYVSPQIGTTVVNETCHKQWNGTVVWELVKNTIGTE